MTTSRTRRFAARMLVAVAALGFAGSSIATDSAEAVILDTDRPRITAQELDFGMTWLINAPVNGGYLNWDVTNGVVTPSLTGTLYVNNASGTCARMQMVFKDGSTTLSTKNGASRCATNGSLHKFNVNMAPFSSAFTDTVMVKLQVQLSNGTWSTVGTSGDWLLG